MFFTIPLMLVITNLKRAVVSTCSENVNYSLFVVCIFLLISGSFFITCHDYLVILDSTIACKVIFSFFVTFYPCRKTFAEKTHII